ncbi:hypothetical protein K523DRAFT_315329 [Schizophyllum commune Tattone D]|nr:hypothetical protein K523DRAFT_315329 [Schizophyllum commune Tattone D]
MTRRWKPKRRRMEQMLEPGNLEARPMWRDILPLEIWQIVFSFCLPTTLFAVRDTCRLFREIVDRDDGRLLAHAPLLLRRPPPDPRWWLRLVKHRGQAKVMREFFGVKNPRTPGLYGSAVYTNLIFRSGRCAMCNAWTAGPPEWIHSRIYLCTKKCKIMFFRTEVVYIQPRHNYLPARSATPHIDRHIIPWLPMVWMPLINTGTNAVLVRDLVAAREEYTAEVLSASSPEERKKRREKLFKFQAYVNLWKESTHVDLRKLKAYNVRLLRKIAARRGVPALRAMRDPAMERILRARSRDRRRLSPSAFTKAGLTGAKGKKRICAQCRISVSRSLYDWHIKQRHPERLPQCRLNFKTGKAEYRCDLCEGSPVKWFTADALGSHEYYKHGIRRAKGHEWRGIDG